MKKFTLLLLLSGLFSTSILFAQKYTWNVATGNWSDSSCWTPFRLNPSIHDTLVFNGSTIPSAVVSDIARDSIASLQLINHASVTIISAIPTPGTGIISRNDTLVTGTGTSFFQELIPGDGFSHGSGSGITEVKAILSNTLMTGLVAVSTSNTSFNIWPRITLLDSSSSSLYIESGCRLVISSPNPHSVSFYMASGAKADIQGTIELTDGRHKFFGADSNCIVFRQGANLIVRDDYNGNIFGLAGRDHAACFEAGSSFTGYNTISAFGTSVTPKVTFFNGSRYIHRNDNVSNLFNGRQLPTLLIDTIAINDGSIDISSGCVVDSLVINQATLTGFSATSNGSMVIRKALIVHTGTVTFGNGSGTQTIVFSNGSNQPIAIGGNGTLNFNDNSNIIVNNTAGIRITKSLTIGGSLTMNAGNIIQSNNDTITIGTSIGNPGSLARVAGYFTGSGYLRRWMDTAAIPLSSPRGLFPMGTGTAYMPFNIGTGTSSGGVIMVKAITTSGRTPVSPAFYDTATHPVEINIRLNRGWEVHQAGFSSNLFSIRAASEIASNAITNDSAVRIVLSNSKAPGTALDGSGTALFPRGTRTGISQTGLNNTFFIGSDSTSNILPVRFLSLKAQRTRDNLNLVSWTLAGTKNIHSLDLEKSYDLRHFSKVTSMPAAGTANPTSYEVRDADGATVYYRVKANLLNGTGEYSQVVGIDPSLTAPVLVSPNPAGDHIVIAVNPGVTLPETIPVYSSSGQRFELIKDHNGFSTRGLAPGIYFIHLGGASGAETVKFVKQ